MPAPFSPNRTWTSPAAEVEIDAVQRQHAREALRDPAQFEKKIVVAGRLSGPLMPTLLSIMTISPDVGLDPPVTRALTEIDCLEIRRRQDKADD